MTTTTATPSLDDLRARLEGLGQGHVLNFYDELPAPRRAALLAQLAALDLDRLPGWIERYVMSKPDFLPPGDLAPATFYPADAAGPDRPWDRAAYREAGEALIAAGKVAAFVVAGGQGSRLGYDGPKGKYPAGAVTGKPLFQMLADWVLAAGRRYGVNIPWYVMTSPINHEETQEYFDTHEHFGLREEDVVFFSQGVMPSLEMGTGRLLLADKGTIATNPDGHGGSLKALHDSGAIEDMKKRGVEHISYFQVDNPIVRAIDPVFIGLHATAPDSSGLMSAKVCRKTDPKEKVGVICKTSRGTEVIEYSDLPDELANERAPDGSLRYSAGSIAIHVIGVEFVERLNAGGDFGLPFHRAEKQVPCVDPETGEAISPTEPNAIKLETFVFDALALAGDVAVLETERVEEFAPIKNAKGNDSPETSTRIQTERAARWLETAGVEVPRGGDHAPDCVLEIDPRTAMWAEDLLDGARPSPVAPGEKRAL
jgi:UDP-N-acetylglucosamine/UDP-N-acetylgalactosamine diphosphorylase